ncbi:hypothetical protein ACWEFJ_34410 [Actinosynnema sp. NPDC004786]
MAERLVSIRCTDASAASGLVKNTATDAACDLADTTRTVESNGGMWAAPTTSAPDGLTSARLVAALRLTPSEERGDVDPQVLRRRAEELPGPGGIADDHALTGRRAVNGW